LVNKLGQDVIPVFDRTRLKFLKFTQGQ